MNMTMKQALNLQLFADAGTLVNATGNYVKVVQRIPVKILIDQSSDPQRLLRIGMSVEPVVITGRSTADVLKELF